MMSDPTGPHLRDVPQWIRASTPVNKSASGAGRQIPQIASPLVIGALGVGVVGAGLALRAMRPARRRGRSDRFRLFLLAALDDALSVPSHSLPRDIPIDIKAEISDGFGKPSLATFDILVPASADLDLTAVAEILDVATSATWNNSELAPLAIRGRVLASTSVSANGESEAPTDGTRPSNAGSGGGSQPVVLADMTVLDFIDETARPDELYARYGAPDSDPAWRP